MPTTTTLRCPETKVSPFGATRLGSALTSELVLEKLFGGNKQCVELDYCLP